MSKRSPVAELSSVREAELAWKYQQIKQLRKNVEASRDIANSAAWSETQFQN